MNVGATAIHDVKIIELKVFGDERGFFMETQNARLIKEAGIERNFVQDNHSCSVKNTLRGLHYQIKQPQGKLVWVVLCEVFDVAVDSERDQKLTVIGAVKSSQRRINGSYGSQKVSPMAFWC